MARSYKSIYSALAADVIIAAIKFAAGFISNSSAMIAEAIHSLVDSVNELLLLFGIKQSNRPRDAERPFGYGRELFFWSFIVSVLIFGLGGGISVYQGVTHIIHPLRSGKPFWNYVVLFSSLLFEGASFVIAAKEFNKITGEATWWETVVKTKDPTNFMVLFEDGAAVLGLIIVIVCVYLGHRLGMPYLEGIASLLVGLILIAISLVLARENRSLLMGEGITKDTKEKINGLIKADESAIKMGKIFSIYLSPEEILLILHVQFKPDLTTDRIQESIVRLRDKIRGDFKLIQFVIIEPEGKDPINYTY